MLLSFIVLEEYFEVQLETSLKQTNHPQNPLKEFKHPKTKYCK